MTQAFDPHGTYVHLQDGGAADPVELTPEFWPELMAGQRHYPQTSNVYCIPAYTTISRRRSILH